MDPPPPSPRVRTTSWKARSWTKEVRDEGPDHAVGRPAAGHPAVRRSVRPPDREPRADQDPGRVRKEEGGHVPEHDEQRNERRPRANGAEYRKRGGRGKRV